MKNGLTVQKSPTPTTLLEKAIEKGVDITQLKELMDLQERWEKKEAKKSFLDAMSLFQTKVPELKKTKIAKITSEKGSFSYKYSDLGSITKTINPILNECGLSYRWNFNEEKDILEVTCVVSHRDGHSEQTTMKGAKDSSGKKNDIQQKGSTHTYLQRYTLIGALGLATADSDNDGKQQPATVAEKAKELNEEEAMQLWAETIDQCKTRVELQNLYLKNRKVVDGDEKINDLFIAKGKKLKEAKPEKVAMP